jgi:hypothetical protein
MANGTDEGREDGRVGDMGDGGEGHPAGLIYIPFLLFLSYLLLRKGGLIPRDLRTAHR